VDGVHPAFAQVRAFDDRGELVLAHPRADVALERAHRLVGQTGRDPHALELLGAFDHAQVTNDG
jgi:hypothetical protein